MLPDDIESDAPVYVPGSSAGGNVEISSVDFTNSSAPHLFEVRTISSIEMTVKIFLFLFLFAPYQSARDKRGLTRIEKG